MIVDKTPLMNRLSAPLLLSLALLGCSTGGSGGGQGGSAPTLSTGGSAGAPSCTDASGCAADQYCAWINEVCHLRTDGDRDDRPGACAARSENCGDGGDGGDGGPVCGCDGKTYESRCAANQAGIDVQNDGGCTSPVGMFACGFAFCPTGESYCE